MKWWHHEAHEVLRSGRMYSKRKVILYAEGKTGNSKFNNTSGKEDAHDRRASDNELFAWAKGNQISLSLYAAQNLA